MAIEANSKSITLPFFRVGDPGFPREGELKETIDACQRAIDAQPKEEDNK